jgi:hypothetical protein
MPGGIIKSRMGLTKAELFYAAFLDVFDDDEDAARQLFEMCRDEGDLDSMIRLIQTELLFSVSLDINDLKNALNTIRDIGNPPWLT